MVTKWIGFVEIFIFRHFVSAFPCEQQEKRELFSWNHVRKRIDYWFSVTIGKCQSSGQPLQCETRKGFSCPHWTTMMDSIFLTYPCIWGRFLVSSKIDPISVPIWDKHCYIRDSYILWTFPFINTTALFNKVSFFFFYLFNLDLEQSKMDSPCLAIEFRFSRCDKVVIKTSYVYNN